MLKIFKSAIDLVLYSHLFIALCALALVFATQLLYLESIKISTNVYFIFFSTLSLYGIHRIIGLIKAHDHLGQNRYARIKPLKGIIWIFSITAMAASAYFLWQFELDLIYILLVPLILSTAYVLPVWKNQRLRDFSFVKVFIIAGVWSMVTIILPLWGSNLLDDNFRLIVILSERFLFILAITLPFDIRDLKVDRILSVDTIPSHFGIKNTKLISLLCLFLAILCLVYLYIDLQLSPRACLGYLATYLFTAYLISLADEENSDYYFSGWLDGSMIVLLVLTWVSLHFPLSF